MLRINVLKKGDQVLNVTSEFIAVKRRNGEVDILPLINDTSGLRIDLENIITIGYGNNMVQASNEDMTVLTF